MKNIVPLLIGIILISCVSKKKQIIYNCATWGGKAIYLSDYFFKLNKNKREASFKVYLKTKSSYQFRYCIENKTRGIDAEMSLCNLKDSVLAYCIEKEHEIDRLEYNNQQADTLILKFRTKDPGVKKGVLIMAYTGKY